MLELAVKTLIAYLLGSLMGALLAGRLRGVDIREMGSGNAGGTNAWRTQGFGFALAVVVVDVGKGALAAGWLPGWTLPGIPPDPAVARDWLAVACATAAIAGHVFPLYHEFRGGKGGATLIGVLAVLAPDVLLPALGAALAVLLLTGYVSVATMTAAASVPAALLWLRDVPPLPLVTLGLAMAGFLAWTHSANLARLRAGSEPRVTRLWLLKGRSGR